MSVRGSQASVAAFTLVVGILGVAAAVGLSSGVQASLRWTIYLLFVPFALLFMLRARSAAVKAAALLVPFYYLEDIFIMHRDIAGIRTSISLPIALVFLAGLLVRRGEYPGLKKYRAPWLILLGLAFIAALRHWGTMNWELETEVFIRCYLEGLLFFVLGLGLFRSTDDVVKLLVVFFSIGVGFTFLHFDFALTGTTLFTPTPDAIDPDVVWRYGGPLTNPNNLACFYAMFAPGALILGMNQRNRPLAVLTLLAVVSMAGSLVLTGSRGGMLSASFAVFTALVLAGRRLRSSRFVVPVVLTVAIVSYLLLTTVFVDLFIQSVDRLEERGLEDVRSVVWEATLDIIAENPLGLGLSYRPYMQELTTRKAGLFIASPHNIYLEFATSMGVAGFLAALALIGMVLRDGIRTILYGTGTRREQVILAALLTAMIGFMAAGMTEPVYVSGSKLNHTFWLICGAIVGMARRADVVRAEVVEPAVVAPVRAPLGMAPRAR